MPINVNTSSVKNVALKNGTEVKKVIKLDGTIIFSSQIDPPVLTVTAPTGGSSSSPTYTTATSYTVSGTFTTEGTVTSVTVNGKEATISGNSFSYKLSRITANKATKITVIASDNYGNTTTVVRYLYRRAKYTISNFSVSHTSNASYTQLMYRDGTKIIMGVKGRTFDSCRVSCSYTFKIPTGYKAYSVEKSDGNISETPKAAGSSVTVSASASATSDGFTEAWAIASITSVTFYV